MRKEIMIQIMMDVWTKDRFHNLFNKHYYTEDIPIDDEGFLSTYQKLYGYAESVAERIMSGSIIRQGNGIGTLGSVSAYKQKRMLLRLMLAFDEFPELRKLVKLVHSKGDIESPVGTYITINTNGLLVDGKFTIGKSTYKHKELLKYFTPLADNSYPYIKHAKFSRSLHNKISDSAAVAVDTKSGYSELWLQRRNIDSILGYFRDKITPLNEPRNFTITKTGEMTFCPAGKKTQIKYADEEDRIVWRKEHRMETKFGKGLRKILTVPSGPRVNDATIEKLNNHLKSQYTFNGVFELVCGESIRDYYNQSNYNQTVKTNSLQNSCMRYDSCSDFFDIYVDNSDKVNMLIAKTGTTIIGRALLWFTDNQDVPMMDRIYGNDVTIAAFKAYAKEQGWYHKLEQSYTEGLKFVSSIGEVKEIRAEVTLINNGSYYPYMDTFKYTDELKQGRDIVLSNYDGCITLDSTDGRGEDGMIECVCGNRYHEDDCTYIDSNNHEGYYHNDEVMWCAWSDEAYHRDDTVETTTGDTVYYRHSELVELYNGEYTHSDDAVYSDTNDESYAYDDAFDCPILGWMQNEIVEYQLENGNTVAVHESNSEADVEQHYQSTIISN